MKKSERIIVLGLGNPGSEYENTYHNAGALALDALIGEATLKKHKNFFEYLETPNAVFVRPLTYMNDSGRAAREALKKFAPSTLKTRTSIPLFLLHDDSDLLVGAYKVSVARGAAGHKGVQSVIDTLGTKNFTRIRIGIRPARERVRQKAGDFALKQIPRTDQATLATVFKKIAADFPTYN